MLSAHDVAAYILERCGPMTAMKLQKLLYYSQAWSLVWDGKPLFHEEIQAWANGPVVYEVYRAHRGRYQVNAPWLWGDAEKLRREQRETVEAVLEFYGDKSPEFLSDLTHREAPWALARDGTAPGSRSDVPISHAAMRKYYGRL